MKLRSAICFIVIFLNAYVYSRSIKETVVQSSPNMGSQFQIIVHSDREHYSIGESVVLRMQLRNGTALPVTISTGFVFDWERLRFSSPHAVHLLDPHGQDLFGSFRQSAPPAGSAPITIKGGGEEWLYLPITNHLRLQEPGNYSFSVELGDTSGVLHHSNRISFRLEDVEYSMPRELVSLSLRSRKRSFSKTEPIELQAIFENSSSRPITFLKPQQDSFEGWVNPVYLFSVIDAAGRGLATGPRCGTMASPIYDESTRFTTQPGESFTQDLTLPLFPEMQQPGTYRVQLTYMVRRNAIGKAGVILDRPMNWDSDVFVGRIVSSELLIIIE